MDSVSFSLLLFILIPSLIVVGITYFLINKFLKNENNRREYELRKLNNNHLKPQQFSAYERIALFLERIKPTALARRISAKSTAKNYENILIQTIQNEWEHNLSQQIYVNPDTWKIVFSAKNATQNFIRECMIDVGESATAEELQEYIIKKSIQENAPSNAALLKLQVDIQGRDKI